MENNTKYKHSDITGKIIGAAMEVHKELGYAFQEVIYQRALAVELQKIGLSFEREYLMRIYYKGEDIGYRKVDFLVEKVVLVELKAITDLDSGHINQTLNYVVASNLEVSLLINFGAKSLQFKRMVGAKHPYNKV